jgi:hypothetical protein
MKKIDGLVKLETVEVMSGKRITYQYKDVIITRTYNQGTVGLVGVKRGTVKYRTAGNSNSFTVWTWNEVKEARHYHTFKPATLKEAIETIDKMLDKDNAVVIKGAIYRNFPQEKLNK